MKKGERGTARETRGGILCKAKREKRERERANYQPRPSKHLCVFVHTQDHMASQSTLPPLHLTIQHKTSFVSSTAEHETTPPPPPLPLNHCAPLLQLSTKRLPGQQSRLNGFTKSSSASIYCLTRACVNTVLDCPDLQYITTSWCYIPQSLQGLAGLHRAYISSSLSWGCEKVGDCGRKGREGAGIEYQAEKERTPRKSGVEKQ